MDLYFHLWVDQKYTQDFGSNQISLLDWQKCWNDSLWPSDGWLLWFFIRKKACYDVIVEMMPWIIVWEVASEHFLALNLKEDSFVWHTSISEWGGNEGGSESISENDIYYGSYHIGYMTWCALYGEAEVLTQMTEPRTMSYAEDGSGANMLHYIFTMPRLPGLILCLTHVRSLGRIYLLA